MDYETEQEQFWAGEFGSDYVKRNQGDTLLASDLHFFSQALRTTQKITSCIEFGANIGMNLKALKLLCPGIDMHAIEINPDAARELAKTIPASNISPCSILEFTPHRTWDLTLIKGVLIHINPDKLPEVYDKLVAACGRYLLIAEYFNPTPVAVTYRGHQGKLFKRDFAGEILERHKKMQLLDYGFVYKHDPNWPGDDFNWFLLEKRP